MKPVFLWKRIPLSQRDKLPKTSGLYAVVSLWWVPYVGKSENLNQRWRGRNHHRLPQAEDLLWPYLHYIELPKCRIDEAEKKLIKELNPTLNNSKVPEQRWQLSELVSIGLMAALAVVVWGKYSHYVIDYLANHGPFGTVFGRLGA